MCVCVLYRLCAPICVFICVCYIRTYMCVQIYVCYIGSAHLDFFKAMEAEHCVRAGCDELFETLNYRICRSSAALRSFVLLTSLPLPSPPASSRLIDLEVYLSPALLASHLPSLQGDI